MHTPTILFLDVDGVLIPFDAWGPLGEGDGFCPLAMANLRKLVNGLQAQVVLTSTWRLQAENRERLLVELAKIQVAPIGDTPDLRHPLPTTSERRRAAKIRRWMADFGPCHPVVLDDDTAANIGEGFWLTASYRGLDSGTTAAILSAHAS